MKDEALAAAGLKAKKKLTANGRFVLAAGDPAASEVALKKLGSDPRVAYAEPNFVVSALRTPNDPSFGQLWGLVNTGQTVDGVAGTADADIDADLAWDVSTGSAASVVGIIDTGVDFSHADLAGAACINQGENCTGCRTNGVDDDGNGYVDDWRGWDFVNEDNDPFDDHGHGTHVAGTIAATGNNGVGVAGINWTGRVAALKFLDWFGSGTIADAVRALDYATQKGIKITNNSWGGSEDSQALRDAIERFGEAGGLYVAAAGNDGGNADQTPMYPAAYPSSAIISVAASDSRDQFASFSNVGRNPVDLAAPGVSIYSTLPGDTYDWWSGTSMATPHVAGAAALVQAARPDAGSMAIKALLLRTVDAKASLAQTATGGRLNVGSAVRCSGTPQLWHDEPSAGFQAIPGEPLRVVALAGVCGEPTATLTATANGSSFTLTGRGDGDYSGTVVPTVTGPLTVAVTAAAGSVTDTRSVAGTVAENYVFSDDAYAWVDATAGGTNTGIRGDDASVTIPLPFGFRFFGVSYTSVKASTNGYVVFGSSAATDWSNVRLPAAAAPNGIVAPFWDDLRLTTRGDVVPHGRDGAEPAIRRGVGRSPALLRRRRRDLRGDPRGGHRRCRVAVPGRRFRRRVHEPRRVGHCRRRGHDRRRGADLLGRPGVARAVRADQGAAAPLPRRGLRAARLDPAGGADRTLRDGGRQVGVTRLGGQHGARPRVVPRLPRRRPDRGPVRERVHG